MVKIGKQTILTSITLITLVMAGCSHSAGGGGSDAQPSPQVLAQQAADRVQAEQQQAAAKQAAAQQAPNPSAHP